MAASVKSKNELEQVALAMMMMAGGEGTSSIAGTAAEVGVKTRSSASRRSSLQQNHNNNRRGRGEPVSGNYLNKNKNRKSHDQPGSSEERTEYYGKDDDNEDEGLVPDPAPEEEESATDLVVMKQQEEPDEAIICAINPLSIQSSPSPGSPAGSLQSTNSGSGGSGAGGGVGGGGGGDGNIPESNNDCIYMSSSRRIFRPEFKQKVLDAFANDPDCVGNQRATARKFGIHRRQVQKWLQQLASGELTFKDSQQQQQGDNEDSYTEPTELTTGKFVQRSSQGNQQGRNSGGKVPTRRSVGGGNIVNRQSGNQRASDPNPRPTRSSVRNRGNKNMPLKGGSKSTSHFVPTIVHPSPSSSSSAAGSSSLINLSKKLQNGGNSSSTATSSYAYYNNDSNGNGTNGNSSSSNMFMNMSTLLASAAAAGNLTMPLSLENPRNFSPRDHSPIHNNGRGSPAHSAGGSSGGSHNSNLQNALLLVDELNYLYPYSDFSLLRNALLKEEVSLEKLAHPLIRGNKSTEFRVNGNGLNSDLNKGLRELRRAAALSPSPAKSTSSREEYNPQNALDILRQQQEYLKLLQQCGIGNSGELTSGLNLSDLSSNGSNGRLPAWFNPFAAAAAAGLPIPSTSSGKFGNGNSGAANASGSESNGRKNNMKQDSNNDNHRFASPRVPPAVNSNKAKTVAAALAATRIQPSSSQHQQIGGRSFSSSNPQQNGRQSQNQRNAQRRKTASNSRQAQSSARVGSHQMDDDMIDPTSMLEVVTSIPSPSNSPATRPNQYGYNGNQRNNGHNDYQQGMDLSTTSTSAATSSSNSTTTASSSTRGLISKAMNKEYSFLSELGLIRKSPENESSVTTTTGKNGYGLTHTASLENFVENILPPRQKSPQAASSSTSSSSPPASDLSDSEKTKSMVIDAFTYDPEISGDARAVARKFGLNVRVVMKWLKEAPVKNSPPQSNENGSIMSNMIHGRINGGGGAEGISDEEDSDEYILPQMRSNVQNLHKAMLNESNNNSPGTNGGTGGVNKRKNSKPNQICDFPAEDDGSFNGALDMVVPIKKRRVSSPSPTSHDG